MEAFVATKEFNEARDDYEENFTSSLIDYLINNNDPQLQSEISLEKTLVYGENK